MTHSTSWFGYFDAAYLINLDSAPEWLSKASSRLQAAGIPFERFAALTVPEDAAAAWDKIGFRGHAGVAMSHRAVLLKAYELGHQRVLIFEDDVVFRNDVKKHMPVMIEQLARIDWDIFYMGLKKDKSQKISRSLGRVGSGWHAHAYGVSRKAMPKLISHIDAFLQRCEATYFDRFEDPTLKKYCANPTLALQDSRYSATDRRFTYRYRDHVRGFDRYSFFWHCDDVESLLPNLNHLRWLGTAPRTFLIRLYIMGSCIYLAIKSFFKYPKSGVKS